MSDGNLKRKRNNNKQNKHNKGKKKQKITTDSDSDDEDYVPDDVLKNIVFSIFPSGDDQEKKPKKDKYDLYLDSIKKKEKNSLIKKEKDLYKEQNKLIPLKFKILNSPLNDKNKIHILEKIKHFDSLNAFSSEYFKLKKYLDGIDKIPFGIYKNMAINKKQNSKTINNYLTNVKTGLDNCIYGQEKAKNSLIEILAKWVTNPGANGNIIGLCGPPGVGKTSLIKNGLATSIKMPFSFISLGGLADSSSLTGFEYTYEGAKCGRIIEILIENNCMNPIIFFDELDKISETKNGEELVSVLIHLTDPTQNNCFLDKYFSGIEFDLSKAFIIFSFNDENKINPILKDRISIIKFDSFTQENKIKIAKDYSIQKICKNIGIDNKKFEIPESTIRKIVSNYCFERGVRKLEQCLEKIIMKINLYDLTKNMQYLAIKGDIKEPYKIDIDMATKILDPIYENNQADISLKMMYS